MPPVSWPYTLAHSVPKAMDEAPASQTQGSKGGGEGHWEGPGWEAPERQGGNDVVTVRGWRELLQEGLRSGRLVSWGPVTPRAGSSEAPWGLVPSVLRGPCSLWVLESSSWVLPPPPPYLCFRQNRACFVHLLHCLHLTQVR